MERPTSDRAPEEAPDEAAGDERRTGSATSDGTRHRDGTAATGKPLCGARPQRQHRDVVARRRRQAPSAAAATWSTRPCAGAPRRAAATSARSSGVHTRAARAASVTPSV